MARADLLYDVIKHGLSGDQVSFRRAVEAVSAEERAKQHHVLAERINDLLKQSNNFKSDITKMPMKTNGQESFFYESIPKRKLDQLILPDNVLKLARELIEEQMRSDVLRSYGLEPRNKILLIGEPGNGKTSFAEAIAEALMIPLLSVRYESVVGSYLGETASRLSKLIDYAKTRQCVLFFDEFETLGKERGDTHETGEIKRVVSSLLLHLDSLPSYVVVIGATNHESLLDKAAWRRFQLRMELPRPTRAKLELWFSKFEKRIGINFGIASSTLAKKMLGRSFAEAEEFALSVYRQYVLRMPEGNITEIAQNELKLWESQVNISLNKNNGGEE